MKSRRVFLLTLVLVLFGMAGGFVTTTALSPNSIEQDGRFVVDPGQPVDSVVARLDRLGLALGGAHGVRLLVGREVLQAVELVQQQVLDPLRALALQRLGPEIPREAGQLLGER